MRWAAFVLYKTSLVWKERRGGHIVMDIFRGCHPANVFNNRVK